MANRFADITRNAIRSHGLPCSYTRFSAGVYNVETGTKVDSSSTLSVYAYKKSIQANQYNYPNLIGKEAAMFYVEYAALNFTPSVRDKITYAGETFTINSYVEHIAKGEVVMYKILGIKG